MDAEKAIESRKKEHVEAARREDVEYSVPAGFSDVRFVHQPLPELDLEAVDSGCKLFGKKLSAPLIIEAMTGGYMGAEKINIALAAAAQREGVALGVGSQRVMLEAPKLASTYKLRNVAPYTVIIGNIGGCQLQKYGVKRIRGILDDIEADALAIHLNPLQEVVQPEGDIKFSGILPQIEIFAKDLGLPVVVKETGAGIGRKTAESLKKAGVKLVDVAGAGGTSWSKVEYMRSGERPVFGDWGNPTCECIASCSEVVETIGSGGVRSGQDAAKAIALGASFAGAALPFLRAKNAQEEVARWKKELVLSMLLTGSKDVSALKKARIVVTGKTAEGMQRLGVDVDRFARR
ncbi:Isopentenyl-diphosphate delta-isomerase [uncultured archaeon]|nr:Isopentenyl-diphosphate delta-isomerase [uncultured archaeon]